MVSAETLASGTGSLFPNCAHPVELSMAMSPTAHSILSAVLVILASPLLEQITFEHPQRMSQTMKYNPD
jgi:hypothetical protein